MRRPPVILLLIILPLLASCGAVERSAPARHLSAETAVNPDAININTAPAIELERIPHIGEALAAAIVRHRTEHGPFRRPEHLMLVDGISDTRFRRMRPYIRIDLPAND